MGHRCSLGLATSEPVFHHAGVCAPCRLTPCLHGSICTSICLVHMSSCRLGHCTTQLRVRSTGFLWPWLGGLPLIWLVSCCVLQKSSTPTPPGCCIPGSRPMNEPRALELACCLVVCLDGFIGRILHYLAVSFPSSKMGI